MSTLILTRPLVSLDIEATGPKPETDRVIELGIVRLAPDGARTVHRWLINPEREIPAESTKVHGITDRSCGACGAAHARAPRARPRSRSPTTTRGSRATTTTTTATTTKTSPSEN